MKKSFRLPLSPQGMAAIGEIMTRQPIAAKSGWSARNYFVILLIQ